MADLAAKRLGLSDCVPLEALGEMDGPEGAVSYGIGKSGVLKEEVTVRELAAHVKDVFGLPFALYTGMSLWIRRFHVYPYAPVRGEAKLRGRWPGEPRSL